MKAANSIMTFMNKGPRIRDDIDYPRVSVAEIKAFKNACTPEEYRLLAGQACMLLGETLED